MPRIIIQDVQRRASHRAFGATLAISIAVHAGALALLPDADHGPPATPAPPLEVVLADPPAAEPRRRLPAPTRAVPVQRERPQPRPLPPPPKSAALQRDVLALPEASGPAAVTVAAPQPQERPPIPESMPPAPAPAPATVTAAPAPARESSTPALYDAAYLHNPPPTYPVSARRGRGITGVVDLKVRVTPEGRAAEVQVQKSSGSAALDGAALETVRKWIFIPGRIGQTPVESWIVVPIVFQLEKGR